MFFDLGNLISKAGPLRLVLSSQVGRARYNGADNAKEGEPTANGERFEKIQASHGKVQ
jgi:hypothetical protein